MERGALQRTLRVRAITENLFSFWICSTSVLPTAPVAPATATVKAMIGNCEVIDKINSRPELRGRSSTRESLKPARVGSG
jgi:hypothetical protein